MGQHVRLDFFALRRGEVGDYRQAAVFFPFDQQTGDGLTGADRVIDVDSDLGDEAGDGGQDLTVAFVFSTEIFGAAVQVLRPDALFGQFLLALARLLLLIQGQFGDAVAGRRQFMRRLGQLGFRL
jgi:hypothetical protein